MPIDKNALQARINIISKETGVHQNILLKSFFFDAFFEKAIGICGCGLLELMHRPSSIRRFATFAHRRRIVSEVAGPVSKRGACTESQGICKIPVGVCKKPTGGMRKYERGYQKHQSLPYGYTPMRF